MTGKELKHRQEKIDFLKALAAGERKISEILPYTTVFYRQVAEGVDEFVKLPLIAGSGYSWDERRRLIQTERAAGRVYTGAQLEEMREKAFKWYNQSFIIGITSDTPLANCEEDVVM